ncbi:NAD-dependent succinate-semialdehyde dehydrogenase [Novosphingobium malaysiense]|uniref:Aldehyde dehydrogenase n=1 Tax=Novosphingobium malaysiense TaxID=1348853 RepID=A0A0B1ZIY8_9SPHN|nr:NAD-dependent succinate-semialdehyde dehydrogenase [Novosphingobium malaysiense]KHK89116.1 aldehyde dehydrogenase [Novosphingobium malaysiense]
MYANLELYIDGRFVGKDAARAGEAVTDPATGQTIAELPHAGEVEVDEALAASKRAFASWSIASPLERSSILRKAAQIMRDRLDHLCNVMTLEQGKPLVEARSEWTHAIEIFEWCAEEGRRVYGRTIRSRFPSTEHIVMQVPVGPCAVFTPWNFPALCPARKISAALAAGCTVIVRASSETPGCAVEIMRALHEAGLPAGCAQLLFGPASQLSEQLILAPEIAKISFTGSTPIGKHLMGLAAKGAKRTTMELGGNAPVLVFGDCDYDAAIATLSGAKFRNAGQVCVSPARFFVHESLAERFARDMADYAAGLRLGSGLEADTGMGPLANARRVDAMEEFIADAHAKGGTVLTGGKREGNAGHFFRPTVVSGLPTDAMLFRDECFGPILPVMPFSTLDEAIELANNVDAGLAGYAFTRDLGTARQLMNRIETGMLGINTMAVSTPEAPFGGVGESGHGSEGGTEGLQAYLDTKLVSLAS